MNGIKSVYLPPLILIVGRAWGTGLMPLIFLDVDYAVVSTHFLESTMALLAPWLWLAGILEHVMARQFVE